MQLHFWFCFWQAANHYVTMVFLEWTDIISTDSKVLRCWLAGLVWHGSTWFNNAKLCWVTSKPPFISASHQSYKGRGVFSSNPPEPQKRSKETVLAFDCVRFKWFDITLHCMCTNRTRARRVAEVSRFKKCNLTGSKKKVYLQELRQTSILFSGTSDLLWQIMNSSNDFSPLVNSFQLPSFHSTLFSSRSSPLHALLSARVGSPHLSSTCPFFLSQSKWHSCKLSCSIMVSAFDCVIIRVSCAIIQSYWTVDCYLSVQHSCMFGPQPDHSQIASV